MNSPGTGLALVAFGSFLCCPPARADSPPQYRFKNESIPGASANEPLRPEFSPELARQYLDTGAALWAKQKQCVSCHTHGIYLATRPAMTPYWGAPPEGTRSFFTEQALAFVADAEADAGTETDRDSPTAYRTEPTKAAYLARGLAAWDAEFSQRTSSETGLLLRHVLTKLQAEDGSIRARDSWPPLNANTWHGTVMTALAIADAPGWLAGLEESDPLRNHVDRLRSFLRDTPPRNDHERLLLLWASTRLPKLMEKPRHDEIIAMIRQRQRPDGGWSIRNFATLETWGGGKRAEQLVAAEPDYTTNPASDGYQTGLVIVILRDAGIPADDPAIAQGLEWLRSHQRESGRWWTKSLNADSRFHYITYSGSAYAALALARCDALPKPDTR